MAAGVQNATDGVIFPQAVQGLVPFKTTVTIPTTSIDDIGDDVLICKFPEGVYLYTPSLLVQPSDMDTNGTPTLGLDFGFGDSDGVIDTVLINDSVAARTGVADEVDTGITDRFSDCGGKYFIMSVVTAAATAAAGTLEVEGLYAPGLVPRTAA